MNWATNVRKRNRKATVEKGKKPHHYLDFLFLANDREMKALAGEDSGPNSNASRKLPQSKKKAKKAPAKKQRKVKHVMVTNKKEKPPLSKPLPKLPAPGPVHYQYTCMPGLESSAIPKTPMNAVMQQYSTPVHSECPWNYHAPMQQSFVPHFHPGAYATARQVTPPRFELEANMMDVTSRKEVNLKCAQDESSPIPLSDMQKIDIFDVEMDVDEKKDIEQEFLQEFTQDGLIPTPPRCEKDDMIWDLEFNPDINVKDVFEDSSKLKVETPGCSFPMDAADNNKQEDITEGDVLDLFDIDDKLDTLIIEI